MEKEQVKDLKERLFYKKENALENASEEYKKEVFDYAEKYKDFISESKIEREAVCHGIEMAKADGFKEYKLGDKIVAGGKYYYNNRDKNLFIFRIGTENIENGVKLIAAHIDSPRLDLKQHPLYENEKFAYFKTHYYGGIRKYQWATIPLALHGAVSKINGETINVTIGEDEDDPIFCITDLLPHLAQEQGQKTLDKAFTGEGLNLLIGSEPIDGETDEAVKLNVMKLLNQKYDITESDFMSAELCAVPAGKARDIGIDRSLIAGYGHDDKCCAYPCITAVLACENSKHTVIAALADKEEIGSMGVSGMQCRIAMDLIEEISKALNGNFNIVRANSMCLSADVNSGYDPLYPDVFEKNNSALVNCGVVMSKYTGARGKSGSNDASAEYVAHIRKVFNDNNVIWQTAELGKVDAGGGGTVALYVANQNITTVDLGVPVLSMHAPLEVISKTDLYETHKALLAFIK